LGLIRLEGQDETRSDIVAVAERVGRRDGTAEYGAVATPEDESPLVAGWPASSVRT
jgi:hypothetical protein